MSRNSVIHFIEYRNRCAKEIILSRDLKVLYAEDEELTRMLLSRQLIREFKEVYTAENGMEALSIFKERMPDILITDLAMPVMNGYDLVREAKKIKSNVIVIIMSAYKNDSIDLKADFILSKPIVIQDILSTVDSVTVNKS